MHRHDLTDEQWSLVSPLFPASAARTGRPASDPRLMLNGIFWILGTGAPWRDLPERCRPWQTVHDHFRKWRKSGVFADIVEASQVKLDATTKGTSTGNCGALTAHPSAPHAPHAPRPGLTKKCRAASGRTAGPRTGPQQGRVRIEVPRCR